MSDETISLLNPLSQEEDPKLEISSTGKAAAGGGGNENSDPNRIRTKSNEEVIREELRATGQGYLLVWRTGISILPALLLATGFFRREVFEQMVKANSNLKLLPLDRYLLGTLLLFIIALSFNTLIKDIASRYRWYAEQLKKTCENPIELPPVSPNRRTGFLFRNILYVFPLFDLFVRLILEAEVRGWYNWLIKLF